MNAGQVGYIFGSIVACLILPVLWLIVVKFVPSLRNKPAVANGVAVGLAWVSVFLSMAGGGDATPLLGGLVVSLLLWWNYRRDMRELSKAQS